MERARTYAMPDSKHEPPQPSMRELLKYSYFPPADQADEAGLLAAGGFLNPDWLLDAYIHGIFPWPSEEFEPMLWWSVPERSILEFDRFHISRRLRQTLRSGRFQVTLDRAFRQVISYCASVPRPHEEGTWIRPDMVEAYCEFHRAGYAHSLEVWHHNELAGGIYGVAIGGFFAGESMFHLQTDASKVALAWLVRHLQAQGFTLFDVQIENPHTAQFHLTTISREEYIQRLEAAVLQEGVSFGTEIQWKREWF